MALSIKIKSPTGETATLTAQQFEVVKQTIADMMNGKLSLTTANAIVIQKLEDAGMPLDFGEPHDEGQADL
jgi:plasmid maintenance system antidote protein VapI